MTKEFLKNVKNTDENTKIFIVGSAYLCGNMLEEFGNLNLLNLDDVL